MIVEIEQRHSGYKLRSILEELEGRHGSYVELERKVADGRCDDPREVDDYLVWRSLIFHEKATYYEVVKLTSYEFYRAISPKRMELLDFIGKENPESIKECSERLERNYKNVYDDIAALAKVNLVELIGHGKSKRPVSHVSSIRIVPDKELKESGSSGIY